MRREPVRREPHPIRPASGPARSPWRSFLAVAAALAIAAIAVAACQSELEIQGQTVQVVRAVSGQTVEVRGASEDPERVETVRLVGLNAPDLRQDPWGLAAQQALAAAVGDGAVLLELGDRPRDDFGRLLGYLWRDGRSINESLVKDGFVLAAPPGENDRHARDLAYAQDYARILGLGIWDPENPMRETPAEFRRRQS